MSSTGMQLSNWIWEGLPASKSVCTNSRNNTIKCTCRHYNGTTIPHKASSDAVQNHTTHSEAILIVTFEPGASLARPAVKVAIMHNQAEFELIISNGRRIT
jgi:hypothetical protein